MLPARPTETEEMLLRLQDRFAQDPEARILPGFRRWIADPLKPQDEKGRFRPHPIALLMAVTGLIAIGTFMYFAGGAQ